MGCSRKSTLPERQNGNGDHPLQNVKNRAFFPSPPTDENDGGLCVFRDLLQQLQLVFGLGAMHPGHQDRLLLRDNSVEKKINQPKIVI